ncbi:MAG TPA: hypothetical protein VKM93_06655 [Terriglobia bacterium]|nr:hypothetical protein [Terriglobia bacterium]
MPRQKTHDFLTILPSVGVVAIVSAVGQAPVVKLSGWECLH